MPRNVTVTVTRYEAGALRLAMRDHLNRWREFAQLEPENEAWANSVIASRQPALDTLKAAIEEADDASSKHEQPPE